MTLAEIQAKAALALASNTLDAGTIDLLADAFEELGEQHKARQLRTLANAKANLETGEPVIKPVFRAE
jgi:hypothetical protein